MAYRTVKQFPAVGDELNRVVQAVVEGKLAASEAAQKSAVARLRLAGAG